jgi:hypothetical protein
MGFTRGMNVAMGVNKIGLFEQGDLLQDFCGGACG